MKTTAETEDSTFEDRPRNKANMDQPQEEFIEAQSAYFEHDVEHGDELHYVSHSDRWQWAKG